MAMVKLARTVGTTVELRLSVGAILEFPSDDDALTRIFELGAVVERDACAHHAVAEQHVNLSVVEVGSQSLLVAGFASHAGGTIVIVVQLQSEVTLGQDAHAISRLLDALHKVIDWAERQSGQRPVDATADALICLQCLTTGEGGIDFVDANDVVALVVRCTFLLSNIAWLNARTCHTVAEHTAQTPVQHQCEFGRRQHVTHLGETCELGLHRMIDLHDGFLSASQHIECGLHGILCLGSHQ